MPLLKLYTFRGKNTGKVYYATGFNAVQAAKEVGISPRHLEIEKTEPMPAQAGFSINGLPISPYTARYHHQR